MKIILIINARSSSKRLSKKHFLNLWKGKTPIEILCKRLSNLKHQICIATTTEESDFVFDKLEIPGVSVFHGSISNIPYRQYQAAISLGAEFIVSVDGDDVFTSSEAIEELISKVLLDSDHHKFYFTSGLPLGMNVSAYSTKLLGNLLEGKKILKFETGWGRLFEKIPKIEIPMSMFPFPDKKLRFTLDYPEDLTFFQNITSHFDDKIWSVPTLDIVKYVVDNQIYEINEKIVEKYWKNFFREKELEENASR